MVLYQLNPFWLFCAAFLCVSVPSSVSAQILRISPSIETSLSWTDNNEVLDEYGRKDWIVELKPGLNISRESGRFNGRLYARLRHLNYANDSFRNTTYLALQGKGEVELWERFLFLDLETSIDRNNHSVFYGRPSDDFLNANKKNESRMYAVSPRVQLHLWDGATGGGNYLVRKVHRNNWGGGDDSSFEWQTSEQFNLYLSDVNAFSFLGWRFDYSHIKDDYEKQNKNNATRENGRLSLYFNVSPQFRLRAIAGYESNDYGSLQKDEGMIRGGGLDWNPTERTTLSGYLEKRQFGDGYNFNFSHRMPRSEWNLSASKDISSSVDTFGADIYQNPLFSLYFNSPLIISMYPDPVEREMFIRQLLGYPTTGSGDFVNTNAYFLSRSLRGGFTLYGARSLFSVYVDRNDRMRTNRITGLVPGDDFFDLDSIKTDSVTLTLNYRLTPISSFDASISRSKAEGQGRRLENTKRDQCSLGVSTKLGPKTFADLVYRYQRSRSDFSTRSNYTENSITANIGVRF